MNDSTARHILAEVQYATIATVDTQGHPWNTPVFCAYDEQDCIYWSSSPESVHSQNIALNPKVFIVIYNSKAGEGEGVGLYMDTTVEMLTDLLDIEAALSLLGERRGKPFHHPEKFSDAGPQRIYKATPNKCWINDAEQDTDGDFIEDYRIEVQ